MTYIKSTIMFLLTVIILCGTQLTASAAEPNIRVGLWTGQSSVIVSSDKFFTVKDPGTGDLYGKFNAGDKVLITQKNDRLYINNVPAKSMVIAVQPGDENGRTEVNRKAYRGRILIKKAASGMTVINDLPLEEYLYSVIPEEMSSSWAVEALKAQAVAARSYALYSMHRHENEGFDVCASSHCQVYGGSNAENEIATKAVEVTNGEVVVYGHKPICAVFHASAGGSTENSEDVWGTVIPYLRAVVDADQKSPDYHWTLLITPTDLSKKLAQYGYDVGRVQSITLSDLNSSQPDRSSGGAVKDIIFSGDKNIVKLTGNEMRRVLGLKSTKFAVNVIIPSPKTIDVTIDPYSGYGKTIDVDLPDREIPKMLGSKNIHMVTNSDKEVVRIDGYGSGHRIGMSQWGAKALADQGLDYKSILYTYYTEISMEKWY